MDRIEIESQSRKAPPPPIGMSAHMANCGYHLKIRSSTGRSRVACTKPPPPTLEMLSTPGHQLSVSRAAHFGRRHSARKFHFPLPDESARSARGWLHWRCKCILEGEVDLRAIAAGKKVGGLFAPKFPLL